MHAPPVWRTWRTAPAVALLAAAALSTGIGAATAIYSVVNGVMLKPLPYRDGDRFVALFGAEVNDPEHYSSLTSADARAYRERTQAFDAFGWFRESGKNLMFAGEPHHVEGAMLTIALARELGVDPMLGRWFDDDRGLVLSRALWSRLGARSDIVGKPLTLDGRGYVVTGVMPESFKFPVAGIISPGETDVWMALDPNEDAGAAYFAYARRKPGVSFVAAEADVKRVAAAIAVDDPAHHVAYTARVFDLRDSVVKDVRPTLLLIAAAAALLFLITCANAAGLLLARAVARARETAMRVALGAGRTQLAVQYVIESLPVALAGAAGGVVLSVTLTPAIVSVAGDYLPRAGEVRVDWTVLAFALSAAVAATAIASLAPLWQATRTAPAEILGEGARASAGARSRRLSHALVIGEIALAFALLAVSALLILHLRALSRTSPGFDANQVLTFVLSIPGTIAHDPDKRLPLQHRIVDELRTIPGVEEVAFANQLPLVGCCMSTTIYPDGRAVDLTASQRTSLMAVSPEYMRAMRIPLRRGRMLTERDNRDDLVSVVVGESTARRYWGDRDPLGAYGRFATRDGSRFQVVGVVGDVKNDGLGNPSVPEVYILSTITTIESMKFVVRSSRPAAALVPDIRRVVRAIDPEQPVHRIATMGDIVRRSMTLERTASLLTAFFAGAALLMAMLGVYSIIAYSVRQRTAEIGTRMALGATRPDVLGMIVRDGLALALAGVVAGAIVAIAGAWYLVRLLKIDALGPAPFLYSASAVALVALAASLWPAWRASRLSPMVAIRTPTA